ncbi:MAG: hypothetical protein E7377_03525 [Clostridiales bacterium]|nr:hypothetical protein [Clostridiales bacterium]
MKRIKKTCIALLALSCIAFSGLGFASCGDDETSEVGGNSSVNEPTQIQQVYAQYIVYAEEQGETPLSYEDWLAMIKGEKGDKGDQGEQGIQGEKGDKGDQGEQGIQGEKGDKGDQGEQGIQGEKGDKGDQGEKGDKGDQGEQGIQGEKGDKGDQGEQGIQGEKGDKGDQGEQGIQGEKGDKGDQGEQGIQGEKGDKGDQGEQGIQGEKGDKGDQGEQGIQGEKGDKGNQGETGVGIEKVEYDANGDLKITFTDGSTQTVVMADKHMHTYGEWTAFTTEDVACESRLFFRACSTCNTMEWQQGSYQLHDWKVVTTVPTCQEQGYDTKTCNLCGKVVVENYTDIIDHPWGTEYNHDDTYHWRECNTCDQIDGKKEHTFDKFGECSVCKTWAAATEGVVYDISSDRTYARVTGYEGTDTIVRIADSYYGLPVKMICDNAFSMNQKCTSIIIPDSITTIGYSAFEACVSLKNVIIGNGVTSIESSAFDNCPSLQFNQYDNAYYLGNGDNPYLCLIKAKTTNITSCIINVKTRHIVGNAFYNCSNLTAVHIQDIATWCNITFGNADANPLSYAKNLFWGNRLLTQLIIPETVTEIKEYAFLDCDSLISVVIPDSVTSIASSAFRYCSSLASVVIGDGVTSIGYSAFAGCSSLTSVVIGGNVMSIGEWAFSDCSSLEEVEIPDIVTSIGNSAFYSCSSLKSAIIGDSVTSIGSQAFASCSGLTSVVIGGNVMSIGEWAFSGCGSLTSIVIPDSVTSIGTWAFSSCGNLANIIIGKNVTSIGNHAFYDCSSLTSVVIPTSVTSIGELAFACCYNLTIYCERIQQAPGWSNRWNSHDYGGNKVVPVKWGNA